MLAFLHPICYYISAIRTDADFPWERLDKADALRAYLK